MSILDGLMQYDLECEVLDAEGKLLFTFNAREITPYEKTSSPILGIASLGHSLTIATMDLKMELIPNEHNIRILGKIFLVTGITKRSKKLPYGKTLNLPTRYEWMVYLE